MRGGQTWLLLLMVLVDRCQAVPPVISGFPSVYRVIAGDEVGIDCSTYTTDGVPPTTTYSWRSGAYRQDGPVLGRVVQRGMDSETYNCTASNTQGEATASVFVDILYPPNISGLQRSILLENVLNLNCSNYTTPGNPDFENTFMWSDEDGNNITGPILTLNSSFIGTRTKLRYTCYVSNLIGSDTAYVDVILVYTTQRNPNNAAFGKRSDEKSSAKSIHLGEDKKALIAVRHMRNRKCFRL
ncbi:hemicentin-1-like isoform X3 [Haliotis rufescens]|uniref:hemicentin-1-like isoform X3 n=1 Tax=Haliotis rufescens TaxID=6454 RepID=UPI00201ED98F|nr:hemicentin-1-like isoform X3 [Haliotis rufescens]